MGAAVVISFCSAVLRGFLVFFSGALGSLGFGLGPGFLRSRPEAVVLAVVAGDEVLFLDDVAGV